jgi:hypothetical protein
MESCREFVSDPDVWDGKRQEFPRVAPDLTVDRDLRRERILSC